MRHRLYLQDLKRAAMILAWSISHPAQLVIPKWYCIPTPAILSVTPSPVNIGSTCMRMICIGIYPRWDGQKPHGATYLGRGSWAQLCLYRMHAASSTHSKHWRCCISIL